MNFVAPIGLAGLAVLVPIILLYFLKLRREEIVVSSTLLWRRVIRDLQANAPFQRLRYSLLLILQMIAVALLAFALARPGMNLRATAGRQIVLLMDTSASMKTRDAPGGRTRIEAARADALALAGDLSERDAMAVVAFDSEIRVLTSGFSSDGASLRAIISAIEARDMGTDAAGALRACASMCEGNPRAEILLLSDGAFRLPDASRLPPMAGRVFKFVSYGGGPDECGNAGITGISVRRRFVRPKGGTGGATAESQVFVMTENFGARPVRSVLEIFLDGRPIGGKTVELAARGRAAGGDAPPRTGGLGGGSGLEGAESFAPEGDWRSIEVFRLPPGASGIVRIALTTPGDMLAADDQAWAFVSPDAGGRVLTVTAGNYFLDRIASGMEMLSFERTTPEAFRAAWEARGPAVLDGYDAAIFDGCAPPQFPEGCALFLGAAPPIGGYRAGGVLEGEKAPQVEDWHDGHPVMRFVNLGNVDIAKAIRLSAPRSARELAWARDFPLISAMDTDRMRIVAVAFDPLDSNWPLRTSFPIFMRNALLWLVEGSPRHRATVLRTGDPIVFPPESKDAGEVEVTDPSGGKTQLKLSAENRTFFRDTWRAGIYTAELPGRGEGRRVFAVNLADGAESNVAAGKKIELPDRAIESRAADEESSREIWRHLAFALLLLLAVEWWVYHRRVGM
ncbi:MAG: BatA and WFA domain-containing protein [Planctomycetota bacterium]|nr:BatA and WFA domain-containing protein [Planctomycetota bacterium]